MTNNDRGQRLKVIDHCSAVQDDYRTVSYHVRAKTNSRTKFEMFMPAITTWLANTGSA